LHQFFKDRDKIET